MSTTETRVKLSVNVDHVATLRQARHAGYPDPVEAAHIAEAAGAHGITVHLRGDRRHIQDHDVERLAGAVAGKLNLEMAATDDMIRVALAHPPHQVSLVPERPDELTTEGGLDLLEHGERVRRTAERLREAGVEVSLFLDPDRRQIDAAAALPRELIGGFEINTDAYTQAFPGSDAELEEIRAAARRGADSGLRVYAGHGLTTANVGPVASLPEIEELNIGHFLVSRAVLVGMTEAVHEMLRAIDEAG